MVFFHLRQDMRRVWCVGLSPDDSRLSSIPNAVFQSTSEGCDILLFATLRTDSQASSIEQNINSMHKSLEVSAEHGIQRVIVLGDVSSLEGRRWKGITQPWESSMGVSINSVHGMGQLIVEVLARSAALRGQEVIVLRIGAATEDEVSTHIKHAIHHHPATLQAFHNPSVPDLDGWTALCIDSTNEFNSEIPSEQWKSSRES